MRVWLVRQTPNLIGGDISPEELRFAAYKEQQTTGRLDSYVRKLCCCRSLASALTLLASLVPVRGAEQRHDNATTQRCSGAERPIAGIKRKAQAILTAHGTNHSCH